MIFKKTEKLIIPHDLNGDHGRIQDFKLGGGTLKNRAERGEARKLFGYFA